MMQSFLSRFHPCILRRVSHGVVCTQTLNHLLGNSTAIVHGGSSGLSNIVNLKSLFSSDSHADFAPKLKVIDDVDEALKIIKSHVESNRIMLYMKGNPSQPMCGFSAKVVNILKKEGIDFSSVNVLDYPSIREGVKKYSEWPTIPQLYIDGQFIGGCDIVMDLHESGELKQLLKGKTKE